MEKSAHVVVALPSTGQIHQASMASIRKMINSTQSAAEVVFWWENAQPHDRCRNRLLRRFVSDSKWTHLLFVDTDVVVEDDTIDRMLVHDAPIVCAPVPIMHRRYGPDGEQPGVTVGTNIMIFDDPNLRGQAVQPDQPGAGYRYLDPDDMPEEPFTCDASGLGLCLIRRDVVEKMEQPWCVFASLADDEFIGEDVYFLRQARLTGFDILIDPTITCDHYKRLDLTHLDLLYAEQPPCSPWPARQKPCELPGVVVAVCVPRTGWVDVRLTEVLQQWEKTYAHRIRIEYIFADNTRGAMAELANVVTSCELRFEHVLVLSHDVVPHESTLGLLASVDAPVVSGLSRRFHEGQIRWSFWSRSPETGQLVAPQNINLPMIDKPFDVTAIDPACVLIRREAFAWVNESLDGYSHSSDADEQFAIRWCERIAKEMGKHPVQVPMTVERVAEVGLFGLLRLKMALKRRMRVEKGVPMAV